MKIKKIYKILINFFNKRKKPIRLTENQINEIIEMSKMKKKEKEIYNKINLMLYQYDEICGYIYELEDIILNTKDIVYYL